MTKTISNPKEKMRLNIELADNGIIIRNPDSEDEVTLAISKDAADGTYHGMEERELGKKIYSWLMNEVIREHETGLIVTNFDIEITAICKGRSIYDNYRNKV